MSASAADAHFGSREPAALQLGDFRNVVVVHIAQHNGDALFGRQLTHQELDFIPERDVDCRLLGRRHSFIGKVTLDLAIRFT